MANVQIDFSDPDLFGNDAAEDERDEVFNSYVVARSEIRDFTNDLRPLVIARAFKGEGKSALLRLTTSTITEQEPDSLVIHRAAPEFMPPLDSSDYAVYIRLWKAALLRLVAQELGSKVNMAWNDDAITLVEEAERGGARSRGLVSLLLNHFKPITPYVQLVTPEASGDHQARIQRYLKDKPPIWLIIDDN